MFLLRIRSEVWGTFHLSDLSDLSQDNDTWGYRWKYFLFYFVLSNRQSFACVRPDSLRYPGFSFIINMIQNIVHKCLFEQLWGHIFWWISTVWPRDAVMLLINARFRCVHEKPYLSHCVDQGEARVVLTTREQLVITSGSRFSPDMGEIMCFNCLPSNTIVFFCANSQRNLDDD